MPEFISVEEFIAETLEDYSSPTTSSFITKMTSFRNSANNIEEVGCLSLHLTPNCTGDLSQNVNVYQSSFAGCV